MAETVKPKQVFDYVVLNSTRTEIVAQGRLMAENTNKAMVLIARQLPDNVAENIDELEVLIRPF